MLALAVGWGSILAAIRLPLDHWIRPRDLQRAGGAALAGLALSVLGLPIAAWHVFSVLVAGLVAGVLATRRHRRRRPD